MAAVNCLYVAAASTAASAAALQWWASSLFDGDAGAGEDGAWLGAVLRSKVTVALLANLAVHVFLVIILALKTLFFVQLTSIETRKVLEHIINYVIYKGTFLPLVVPPTSQQIILWSTWLVILCSLKMFQSLARERLEKLNASPSVTPSKYFRVYSALLLVLSADLLWMWLCAGFCSFCNSKLFWLLFFEPLSIAFDTLQSIMVHGFQLFDIWQQHLMESGADFLDLQKSYKQAAGSFSEWRGKLTRNFGFAIDLISLLMSLGHYSMIFWLRGMAFHLVDAVLLLNSRALIVSFLKRIKAHIKLRKALSSLDGALPDATYDEICAYDDECAICRGPMGRAKKLSCNHLFHLACLRSWLDQGLMEGYSCPTCRRPLLLSSEGQRRSTTAEVANVQRIAEQLTMGMNQQRVPGNEHPVEQQNPSDAVWRGAGLDASWIPPWSSPVMDHPSSSSAVRSVGLTGVQMMMTQLASVTDNYGHADGTWNLWPEPMAGSSLVPSTSSISGTASASGLRLRGSAGISNGSLSEVLTMVDRVREVLPHIPDELILEDLMRTNNINATVNNLLLMQ
ncbi:protein binding protein [Zea mays]|uniref:RING-type E3 ubiquitin transferase n=3 Tax=Zea mays TaxID=4577 RepID=C0P9F1_MAIZE|nr:protein binding protein [Zea mays]ACN30796.1 unknown [Zea mays]ONM23642.1 E3 ubiquitin protein ligase RIN2 [Zea mays]ONM23648.1 E3 ubiquitin protein ligase RIN2 [Zea mays]